MNKRKKKNEEEKKRRKRNTVKTVISETDLELIEIQSSKAQNKPSYNNRKLGSK